MRSADVTRWLTVWATVGAGVVAAGHVGKVPPALPDIRAGLDLSLVQGGWIVSAFNTIGLVAAMMLGMVCDALGHRRAALAGLMLLIVGGILGGVAQGFATLLAARIVEGVGFIVFAVSAPALVITASTLHHRHLALSFWSVYAPTGASLMMLASPLFLGTFGWRGLWLGLAVVTALCAVGLARAAPPAPAPAHAATMDASTLAAALKSRGAWWLAIAFGAYTAQWGALMVWLPSFLVETRHAGSALAAALGALVVVSNVPGNLFGGWLLHRGIRHSRLIAGSSAMMGLCALGILSPGLADGARYALCMAFSCAGGMLPAAVLSGAPAHAPTPAQVSMVNGLVVQGSNAGWFVGPPVLAALVAASGRWEATAPVFAAGSVLGIIAGIAAGAYEREQVAGK